MCRLTEPATEKMLSRRSLSCRSVILVICLCMQELQAMHEQLCFSIPLTLHKLTAIAERYQTRVIARGTLGDCSRVKRMWSPSRHRTLVRYLTPPRFPLPKITLVPHTIPADMQSLNNIKSGHGPTLRLIGRWSITAQNRQAKPSSL